MKKILNGRVEPIIACKILCYNFKSLPQSCFHLPGHGLKVILIIHIEILSASSDFLPSYRTAGQGI